MKRIFTVFLSLLIFCSTSFADMTAEEKAYFRAKEPSDDPMVGFWQGIHATGQKGINDDNNAEYYTLFPAPEDRPDWDYVIIALEQLLSQKPGETIALLRKTKNSNIYFAKLVPPNNPFRPTILAPVVYNDGYLDFRGVFNPEVAGYVPIMIKIDDYVNAEIDAKYPPQKDESWRDILAPAK